MSILVDQQKNFSADFGPIFRSSAIFYIPLNIKTTITVSNYWDFKNGQGVGLLFSIRDMNGRVVERRERYFTEGLVINEDDWPVSQGSVEVEAFGNKNLRIPYAAVMGIYETSNSITMVHSYGRNHNLVEIEDGDALTSGRESCWTIRHNSEIRNKAIFHNGHIEVDEQIGMFTLTKYDGEELNIKFDIPRLLPFQTHIFDVQELYPDYKEFLSGEIGWGTIHFENKSAFTRLLLVWENMISGEFQVTHSNFDYSEVQTNKIEAIKPGYMKWPSLLSKSCNGHVVIYPKFSKGRYKISSEKCITETEKGIEIKVQDIDKLEFTSSDSNSIPSRIVTGFRYQVNDNALAFECSMGIVHEKRPPKRFHWSVVSKKFRSRLFFNEYSEIYHIPDDMFVVFRLYASDRLDYSERKLELNDLSELPDGIEVSELFMNDEKLNDDFCYISMFSNFGGLFMYSSMEKEHSMTIEHSF